MRPRRMTTRSSRRCRAAVSRINAAAALGNTDEGVKELINRLDKPERQEPSMKVNVEGDKVTVQRGDDVITTKG